MKRLIVGSAGLCLLATAVLAQQQSAPIGSIEGVWKVAEVVTTGAGAETISSPQASLIMFTRGHYSYLIINGAKARKNVKVNQPATEADKVAKFEEWSPFTANAGTYTIKGTTLTRRPTVAKNENVMSDPPQVQQLKLDGTTLWLTTKSAAGQPVSETRTKLVRVQ